MRWLLFSVSVLAVFLWVVAIVAAWLTSGNED